MIETEIKRKKEKTRENGNFQSSRLNCKFSIVDLDHKILIEDIKDQLNATKSQMSEKLK